MAQKRGDLTKALINEVQVFINRSLRMILGIRWYDKMRNVDLWSVESNGPGIS